MTHTDHTDHADCAHSAALDAARAGTSDVRARLAWALGLTALFMIAEVIGGVISNSLALLADAGHMLTDAGALALALGVSVWNARRTHEADALLRRREAWAAGINAVVLLLVSAGIIAEAIGRFRTPEAVETSLMLVVAVIGLGVNIAAALILRPASGHNLNARGAYLHVLGDLLGSVGTIAAALIIRATGFLAADPIASVLVCVLVLRAAVSLLRDAIAVLGGNSVSQHSPS